MRRSCAPFRKLHELEVSGGLTAWQFARLDRHRESCLDCAARSRRTDPLGLFRALAREKRDETFWTGLNPALRAGIREKGRLGPGESFLLLRPAYRVGVAAVLVLAAGLAALILSPGFQGPVPSGLATGKLVLTGAAAVEVALPTVESIRSPGATVYEMKVFGEGDRVTQLVLIFDEGIEL